MAVVSASNEMMSGGELRQMFQTIAAVELYRAQYEAAKFLELAYIGVVDHPDLAKAVRLTAHAARTQHVMSVGLMKSFTATSAHIVRTLIPMILDAVDLEDKALVIACFNKLITLATNMKGEAEKTRQSYLELQKSIQDDISKVHERNKHVVDEKQRLQMEQEREATLAKEAERAAREYEEEKAKMEEELETLKQKRDVWMDRAGDKTFLDSTVAPSASLTGLGGGIWGSVIGGVTNVISSIFGGKKKNDHFKQIMQAIRENQAAIERVSGQKWDVVKNVQQKRKENLERLASIKKMNLEYESLGDEASLQEAGLRLGDVDRQFLRIVRFWQNMVVTLQYLRDDVEAGRVYLDKLENPKYADRFKKSITNAEDGWKWFGRLCRDYVVTSEEDAEIGINSLYNFLDGSINTLSKGNRKAQMLAVESQLKDSLDSDQDDSQPRKDEL